MTGVPTLTRDDVLLIVRSLAQVFRGGGKGPVSEAPVFSRIRSLEGFDRERIRELALAALRFFDLDAAGQAGAALQRKLVASTACEEWAAVLHAHWGDEALWFQSSGSTGLPVGRRHTLRSLAGESPAVAPYFAPCERIVSVMPVRHIFGFMHSLWLAKWLDIPVVYAPPLPLANFFAMLREGDVVMGFPVFWQSLLAVIRQGQAGGRAVLRVPRNVTGVTATGPCPPWVITGLTAPSPAGEAPVLAGMEEIYGSTETNGLAIRHGGQEWYELYANWATMTLPGGEKRVRRLLGGNPAEEPVALPDIITWHPVEDRLFKPERRTDKAVQVGGINVYPERVAACIRAHPLVRDCAVRLMRPEEGSRLKVFIVPACGPAEAAGHFGKTFRAWLAERLDTPSRPRRVRLGEALPVNSMGKAADWD